MRSKQLAICSLLSAFAIAIVPSVSAQNTISAGGSGGTAFSHKCADGMVLVGLSARSGQWIDRLEGVCQNPSMTTGMWDNMGGSGVGPVGQDHFGTSDTYMKCSPGYAIKEFSGGAGWYVHSIDVTCYKLGSSARTGGTTENHVKVGTTGGTPYGPYKCPDSKPAIGIFGRAGTYLDRFGLICGYIMPQTPVLTSPLANSDVTTRRPTFDWDAARFISKPYKICINLSSGASCGQSNTISASVPLTTSTWTPTADLPFARGDVVYWRVEACNDSGCSSRSSSFRFFP